MLLAEELPQSFTDNGMIMRNEDTYHTLSPIIQRLPRHMTDETVLVMMIQTY